MIVYLILTPCFNIKSDCFETFSVIIVVTKTCPGTPNRKIRTTPCSMRIGTVTIYQYFTANISAIFNNNIPTHRYTGFVWRVMSVVLLRNRRSRTGWGRRRRKSAYKRSVAQSSPIVRTIKIRFSVKLVFVSRASRNARGTFAVKSNVWHWDLCETR